MAAWMSITMAMNVILQDAHSTPLQKVVEDVDQPVLIAPYPAAAMAAYPVSARGNQPANDDPRCVEACE
ncbi:MAG: hypothetical protein OXN81_10725 [Alphaproteobacteria bacterium]|nr:hypothetical protein [Alphaproteobacteria bacterium]